jgi:hypothetical protein
MWALLPFMLYEGHLECSSCTCQTYLDDTDIPIFRCSWGYFMDAHIFPGITLTVILLLITTSMVGV